jgi:hypothetical protein
MKSRKKIWIAVLCLLSATIITISLRMHAVGVQAATPSVHVIRAISAPHAAMTNASLRAAAIAKVNA